MLMQICLIGMDENSRSTDFMNAAASFVTRIISDSVDTVLDHIVDK